MSTIEGNYQLESNENLDEYFKALGVPYIARKMMLLSNPRLEIKKNEDEKWSITTITLVRTVVLLFKVGEEFEESMPSGVILKNVATLEEDGSILICSTAQNGENVTRKYEVKDDKLIMTLTHEKSGQVAKRYFKRIPN